MYKCLLTILCIVLSSHTIAAHQAAHGPARAEANYDLLVQAVGRLVERSHTVTYDKFREAFMGVEINNYYAQKAQTGSTAPFVSPEPAIKESWEKLRRMCPEKDQQNLILSVYMKYIEWETSYQRPLYIKPVFELLTSYMETERDIPIHLEPDVRNVVILYYIMKSFSRIKSLSLEQQRDKVKKIVVALQTCSQEEFIELFCTHMIISNPPQPTEMLHAIYASIESWFAEVIPDRNLSLDEVRAYLPTAARLGRATNENMGVYLRKCYLIPEPQRSWTIEALGTLGGLMSSIPQQDILEGIGEVQAYSDPSGFLGRPPITQEGVNAIFQQLGAAARQARAAQGLAAAGGENGFEIHRYSDAVVSVPSASGASCERKSPTQMQLIDAVFDQIHARLRGKPLVPFSIIKQQLGRFSSDSAFRSVLENRDDQEHIEMVYTFLKEFHPHQIELWKDQFIRESQEAYQGRTNPTSCVKGIRERVLTGLRGIDSELDKLFAQVEGAHLMKSRAATANPRAHPRELARQLLELGVRPSTPPAKAAEKYKTDFESRLKEYGLEKDPQFKGSADTLAELIQGDLDIPESELNHALRSEFSKVNKGRWKKAITATKRQNRMAKKEVEKKAMIERLKRMENKSTEQRRNLYASAAERRRLEKSEGNT